MKRPLTAKEERPVWMALTAEVNALMARNGALEADCRELRRLYHELAPIVREVRAAQERQRAAVVERVNGSRPRRRGTKKRRG